MNLCRNKLHEIRGPEDRDKDGGCKQCRRVRIRRHQRRAADALRQLKEEGRV